jgi:hypothetical protein
MVSQLKASYEEHGFVVIPGLVTEDDRCKLEEACNRVIGLTRSGKWPHRRTVGKQFPPFDNKNPDSWGVQHVMHPDLDEPVFAQWYTSHLLVEVVKTLLDCSEEELQMGGFHHALPPVFVTCSSAFIILELFNLLINPVAHDFALRWHRDDVNEKATTEEEQAALNRWHFGVSLIIEVLKFCADVGV